MTQTTFSSLLKGKHAKASHVVLGLLQQAGFDLQPGHRHPSSCQNCPRPHDLQCVRDLLFPLCAHWLIVLGTFLFYFFKHLWVVRLAGATHGHRGPRRSVQQGTVQQLLLVSNEDLTVTDYSSYLRRCCHLLNSSVMTLSKPQQSGGVRAQECAD